MSDPDLSRNAAIERWTRIDAYLGGVARRRRLRRERSLRPRTQPELPKAMLSTLPFAALLGVMMVLMIAIAVAAWPASQPQRVPPAAANAEQGTAAKGWFQEAKKEFR